jgi:hypothetical protein
MNFHVSLKHDKAPEINVYNYQELNEAVANLPTTILDLTISDLDPAEQVGPTFPSLSHLTNLSTLTLYGLSELKHVPDLSPNHTTGLCYLKLALHTCYNMDVSSLCPYLLELKITNHSFIDRIQIPSHARRVVILNTPIGVIIPPTNALAYAPVRGFLILENSPCPSYPKIDKLLRPEEYPTSYLENMDEDNEYLNAEYDYDIDEFENSMIPNPFEPCKLRMYEAYQLISLENRYLLKQIFPQLKSTARHHLRNVILDPTIHVDISNLQDQYPIDRASTLVSNPIRRALEFL